MRIEDVEGIGPVYAGKLEGAGVRTTDDLLEQGAKPSGRHALEETTGIAHGQDLPLMQGAERARRHQVQGVREPDLNDQASGLG